MLITTMNDVPGYTVDEVLGASFKSLVGGELKGLTKMLHEGRQEGINRLIEEAEAKGANVIRKRQSLIWGLMV